ncbi:methyl-accepting chemotaxis protein [Agarivorans sp. 1_MG-2023]|uniref:methyl-accepting chemotaxis protein n=1 Tax=Agarivorans sp. 1_MG-2023 TaxID=3062634 RepID=UPI0026E33236|nr:methyl-accepting chemotaxis protein [Agarivorans sp. 1_MG-2023]MDO6765455.1 methyl-accepting chemotaxis protein [Agarivorans sp. 1_MG-2023]
MLIHKKLSITQLILATFSLLCVVLLGLGLVAWKQMQQAENTMGEVITQAFPLMEHTSHLDRSLTAVERVLNNAIQERDEQQVNQLIEQYRQRVADYKVAEDVLVNWLAENGVESESFTLVQEQNELLFEDSESLLELHQDVISSGTSLSERTATFQGISLRINLLLGQLFDETDPNMTRVLLDAVSTDLSAMQLATINVLNSTDPREVGKLMTSNRETKTYVEEDFGDLIVEKELSGGSQGEHELVTQVPWLLNEVTAFGGLLGQYQQYLIKQNQLMKLKGSITEQLEAVNANLSQLITESQSATEKQIEGASGSISTLISSGAVVIPLTVLFCLAMGLTIQQLIRAPLKQLIETLKHLAAGDLSQRCQYQSGNEFGMLSSQLNQVIEQQRDTVTGLRNKSEALGQASTVNRQHGNDMLKQLDEQRSQCITVSAAMTEMEQAIQDVARRAESAAQGMREISDSTQDGVRLTEEALENNQALAANIASSTDRVKHVNESSNAIFGILEVIEGITQQTNLLALNAAIEAARAGEQGRGFAVVADEVRQLAQRTASSTTEIQTMIGGLQQDTSLAVKEIEQCNQSMELNANNVNSINQQIRDINTHIERLSLLNEEISVATNQQQTTSEDVSCSMETISSAAQQNLTVVTELNRLSDDLESVAKEQVDLVQGFKVA